MIARAARTPIPTHQSAQPNATTTASIITTISTISASPPLRRVKVDCIWNYKKLSLTGNLFNPDQDKPTFVLAVAVTF